ncbi:MAG: hypothetical protein IK123_10405, partial [Lachnospiraceae bacterium]|nr:hypothetical protein [Lachnospiraceae bacterium]
MKVRSENYTDIGLKASVNQDSIIDIADERLSVFCVADGMGGHLHGELASKAITDKIGEWHSGIIKKIRIM